MKNTMLALFLGAAVLLVSGCASLPKEVPGGGVAVMRLIFENDSSRTDVIRKYDLKFSDGTFLRLVPRSGMLIIPVRSADLRIVSVESTLNLEGWNGRAAETVVNVPIPFEAGKITYCAWGFRYVQTNAEKKGYYHANWKFVPMDFSMTQALQAQVAKDPNYKYWSQ